MTAFDEALTFDVAISTHTLTWSVTFTIVNYDMYQDISTHTLTWSVTCSSITSGE